MWDFHLHSKYSGCSRKHGEYDLIEAYNVAKERGYTGIGMTDHCNYKGYKKPAEFLDEQRELINKNNLQDKIKLGLEISIINRKGDLGVNPKYLKKLDYYIISEHCHLSKIFSEFFRLKNKFVVYMAEGNLEKIKESVDYITDLTVNAINRNPNTILAHIWRFTRHRGCYLPYTLEKTEQIIEALQNNSVAFELHTGLMHSLMLTDEENNQSFDKILNNVSSSLHDAMISPKQYTKEILKIVKKYDVSYSIGSDGHRLTEVGKIGILDKVGDIKDFIDKMGLSFKKIITPEFFKMNK